MHYNFGHPHATLMKRCGQSITPAIGRWHREVPVISAPTRRAPLRSSGEEARAHQSMRSRTRTPIAGGSSSPSYLGRSLPLQSLSMRSVPRSGSSALGGLFQASSSSSSAPLPSPVGGGLVQSLADGPAGVIRTTTECSTGSRTAPTTQLTSTADTGGVVVLAAASTCGAGIVAIRWWFIATPDQTDPLPDARAATRGTNGTGLDKTELHDQLR